MSMIYQKCFANVLIFILRCHSLVSLPDISKWNLSNVIDMSSLFYDCNSLISIPDISKWKLKNVDDISYMFYECKSLVSLPALSKWKKIKHGRHLIDGNISLIFFEHPNISKY